MKIINTKNKVKIQNTQSSIDYRLILLIYSIFLTYMCYVHPAIAPLFFYGVFLIIAFQKILNLNFITKSLEITKNGIKTFIGIKTKRSIPKEKIHTLYIQENKGIVSFYVNNKESPIYITSEENDNNSYTLKVKNLLNLTQTNKKATPKGIIHKFVSDKVIDNKKNHFNKAAITKEDLNISKSDHFNLESTDNSLVIQSINNFGLTNKNKLSVDNESKSIRFHIDSKNPKEILLSEIKDIKVKITENISGEPGDLIEAKLILITHNNKKATIFHNKFKEKTQFDFVSEEIEKDLTALKATIEFFILSNIDKKLETLDLDSLKEKHEKLKDILPNRDKHKL